MYESDAVRYLAQPPRFNSLEACMRQVVSDVNARSPMTVQIWEARPVTVRAYVKDRQWNFERERNG